MAEIPKKMDALVLSGANEFSIQKVAVPEPGRNEVLCRVNSVAICGTDPEIIQGHFKGRWPRAYPFIPGHEYSAVVVQVGEGSEALGFSVGDRIAGTSHCGCGFCRQCTTGRYNLCENYGREDLGHRQYGHYTNGAYAEYIVTSVKSIFKIPDDMDIEEAALLDPTSIAMHSAKRGRIKPGDSVAVIGPGALGLLVVQCAFSMGAGKVYVIGSGERLQKATPLGAESIDYSKIDPVQGIMEMTDGYGVDVTIDCAARDTTPRQAVEMTHKGGNVVLTGVPLKGVELPLQKMVLEEMNVYGVRANQGECLEVLPLMSRRIIDVRPMITHRFPLQEFDHAYEVFTKRKDGALKVLVQP